VNGFRAPPAVPGNRIFGDMILVPIDSDWGMFVEPNLVLE
jgi:hypothetical protein